MIGYIDRIEGASCVVEWEPGGTETLPLSAIPFPVREGDGLLRQNGRILPYDAASRRREIQSLEDELFD